MRRALLAAALAVMALGVNQSPAAEMKKVAIASFGPHGSLHAGDRRVQGRRSPKKASSTARPSATSTATATSTPRSIPRSCPNSKPPSRT